MAEKIQYTHPMIVVVTGGSAGIGRAVVQQFARMGARIGILARGKERLEDTEKEVKALGGEAIGIETDVAYFDQVEKAAQIVEKQFGSIDIWINNATTTIFSPIQEIKPEEYERVTDVTYLGTVYGTMVALKRMLPRNKGTIVNVGSALAYRAIPLQSAYCGAKHAIKAFTESLRTELLHDNKNIHLSMVQLPSVNTPQFSWSRTNVSKHPQPFPPIYQPELAAEAIVFAALHKRREVWFGTPAVATIIMNKIAPGLVDRFLAMTGYKDQVTGETISTSRPDNLFKPVSGHFGAHGAFDKRSSYSSTQLALEKTPFLHYISDFIFAVGNIASKVPTFIKYLMQEPRYL